MKIANVHLEKINNSQNYQKNRQNLNFQMNYLKLNHFDFFEKRSKDNEKHLKDSLKDENLLYDIFSGKDVDFPAEILNDQDFMQEMFYDVDYMKASNKALKRIIEDKLKDDTLPLESEDRAELAFLYSLFSWQEELFNDPRNSFETGLGDLKIEAKNKRNFNLFNQMPEPAFCSVFNYGFVNKPKTRKQKAEAIVNRAASAAALEAGITLNFELLSSFEPSGLTFITSKMSYDICKTYQMPGGPTSALVAQVSGEYIGINLAKMAMKFLPPGWSNLSQAGITYALHQITGRALIDFCEKNYKNQDLKYIDKAVRSFRVFSNVCGTMDTISGQINKDNPYAELFSGDDRW